LSSQQIIPWVFFDSNNIELDNYVAAADNTNVVLQSDKIPQNFRGILRDVNTIFRSSGGTIAYEKVSSGGAVIRFAQGISATSNGSFDLVLSPGDSVLIRLTADGTGNLDVVWHGELIPINVVGALKRGAVKVDLPFEGGI